MSLLIAINEIASIINSRSTLPPPNEVTKIRATIAKKYKLADLPPLRMITPLLHRAITIKPTRTASGVAPVALMSIPHRCPHIALTGGICVYCPGGPDSSFEFSTQSYTGYEPTSMRAIRHRYDPIQQIRMRISQLKAHGHAVDKVELIVMGGTFLSLSTSYRDTFIMQCYDALSGRPSTVSCESKSFNAKKSVTARKCDCENSINSAVNDSTVYNRSIKIVRKTISNSTDRNINSADNIINSTDNIVCSTDRNISSTKNSTDNIASSIDNNINSTGNIISNSTKNSTDSIVSSTDNIVSSIDNIISDGTDNIIINNTGNSTDNSTVNIASSTDNINSCCSRIESDFSNLGKVNHLRNALYYASLSKIKCVGLTIETRPDYCVRPHIASLLSYGATRIEIGVQSVYEDVARDTNRGHTVAQVESCFALLKDAGLKVIAHMMPNLPSVDLIRDWAQFDEFFTSPKFRTDGIKIYPTMVIKGTGLYEMYAAGKYSSYSCAEITDLLARIFEMVPPWCRIYRVQRDIPMPLVTAGVGHANIREMAEGRMRDLKLRCRDIRIREIGRYKEKLNKDSSDSLSVIKNLINTNNEKSIELVRRDYAANEGWETFLSYENLTDDTLIGMLRLRKCSTSTFSRELIVGNENQADIIDALQGNIIDALQGNIVDALQGDLISESTNPEIFNSNVSIIRELHIYGTAVAVNYKDKTKFQHQGYGGLLIAEAERIARDEHRSSKMAIISGVGVREYYKKFGYTLEGAYMVKMLE